MHETINVQKYLSGFVAFDFEAKFEGKNGKDADNLEFYTKHIPKVLQQVIMLMVRLQNLKLKTYKNWQGTFFLKFIGIENYSILCL